MKIARWMVLGGVAAALVCCTLRPLRAQNDELPAEVAALLDDVADIRTIEVLRPLKLTAEQMDKLAATILASQKEYHTKLFAVAVPPIRDMAKDIKETRRKMVSGAAMPSDLKDKVKEFEDAFKDQQKKQNEATLRGLIASTLAILKDDQVEGARALAKKDIKDQGHDPGKATPEQLYNYFVLKVFINYPRIVPVLQEMSKARSGSQ